MTSNDSVEDIDDADLDVDGYPSDGDDIDDDVADGSGVGAVDDDDDGIEEDIRRMETEKAKKRAERKRSSEDVDEVLDEYPDSNEDIPDVAPGRVNFNKFGKDSSI
jgi:hypothetical protein